MKILKSQIIKLIKGKKLKIIKPVNIYEVEFGWIPTISGSSLSVILNVYLFIIYKD